MTGTLRINMLCAASNFLLVLPRPLALSDHFVQQAQRADITLVRCINELMCVLHHGTTVILYVLCCSTGLICVQCMAVERSVPGGCSMMLHCIGGILILACI